MAAHLLSPKGLASQCAQCHYSGVAPRPDYPPQGKLLLEGIREVRALLDEARPLIRRIRDKERRARLEEAFEQARAPLTEAVAAGHSFIFEALEERLSVARQRAESLLEQLANPSSH